MFLPSFHTWDRVFVHSKTEIFAFQNDLVPICLYQCACYFLLCTVFILHVCKDDRYKYTHNSCPAAKHEGNFVLDHTWNGDLVQHGHTSKWYDILLKKNYRARRIMWELDFVWSFGILMRFYDILRICSNDFSVFLCYSVDNNLLENACVNRERFETKILD